MKEPNKENLMKSEEENKMEELEENSEKENIIKYGPKNKK